jgi:hypothetical protein
MTIIYPIALIGALVAGIAVTSAAFIAMGSWLVRREEDDIDEDARIW